MFTRRSQAPFARTSPRHLSGKIDAPAGEHRASKETRWSPSWAARPWRRCGSSLPRWPLEAPWPSKCIKSVGSHLDVHGSERGGHRSRAAVRGPNRFCCLSRRIGLGDRELVSSLIVARPRSKLGRSSAHLCLGRSCCAPSIGRGGSWWSRRVPRRHRFPSYPTFQTQRTCVSFAPNRPASAFGSGRTHPRHPFSFPARPGGAPRMLRPPPRFPYPY